MLTSYHVHTTRSDGKSSLADIVEAALRLGLDELGISDHYVYLPDGRITDWSMPLGDLNDYVGELLALQRKLAGQLTIRIGIEVDYYPGAELYLDRILKSYPFDYVLGSVHFVNGFPIDRHREEWDNLDQQHRNEMVQLYWDRITQMARSGLFDIAAHLDLYKKFGHLPTIDISEKISEALDAISNAGMSVEINTAGLYKDIKEIYPSEAIVRECYRRSIPIQINSDTHSTGHLTRGYDIARDLAKRVGYTTLATYERRQRSENPISL